MISDDLFMLLQLLLGDRCLCPDALDSAVLTFHHFDIVSHLFDDCDEIFKSILPEGLTILFGR
jgi:hypothetical protein